MKFFFYSLFTLCFLSELNADSSEHLGYFDACNINAYALQKYDVQYTIEYRSQPSANAMKVLKNPVIIEKQLRGRIVYDAEAQRFTQIEEAVHPMASVELRLANPESKEVVGGVYIVDYRDGKISKLQVDRSVPVITREMEFKQARESGRLRALPLVGVWGWNAIYRKQDQDSDRGWLKYLGDAQTTRHADDSINVIFTKEVMATNTENRAEKLAVSFVKKYRFDAKDFVVLEESEVRTVEGKPGVVASEARLDYEDFGALKLPVKLECMEFLNISTYPERSMRHEERRKVVLRWSHVNDQTKLRFPETNELQSAEYLQQWLGEPLQP